MRTSSDYDGKFRVVLPRRLNDRRETVPDIGQQRFKTQFFAFGVRERGGVPRGTDHQRHTALRAQQPYKFSRVLPQSKQADILRRVDPRMQAQIGAQQNAPYTGCLLYTS